MIQSKKDYLYYLACDKIALQQKRNHPRLVLILADLDYALNITGV